MPSSVSRLRTRADRLRADQAHALRQLVLDMADLPQKAAGEIVAAIDRETASISGWTFVMISPVQHSAVVAWLETNSRRPVKALRLWAECFTSLRMDTGQIMLRRDELASRVGIEPRDVSRIMGELARCGAILRHRDEAGRAEYYLNPRVGTHLAGAVRDQAQADAPLLTLIEGEQR